MEGEMLKFWLFELLFSTLKQARARFSPLRRCANENGCFIESGGSNKFQGNDFELV